VQVASAASRVRVLLVDDEDALLESMAALLEGDCVVSKARDGHQALALLTAGAFDVVCSDYQMPRMNGLDLLRCIRARSSDVGFVLVTGMRDYLDKVAEQPDGGQFHAVLVKPYDPQQLIEAVERAAKFANMRRAVDAAKTASGRLRKRSP